MFKGRPPEPRLNLAQILNERKQKFEGPEKVALSWNSSRSTSQM
jgi:hypothetical protein